MESTGLCCRHGFYGHIASNSETYNRNLIQNEGWYSTFGEARWLVRVSSRQKLSNVAFFLYLHLYFYAFLLERGEEGF